MTSLEGCVKFWESKLTDKGLFEVSTITIIRLTIKYLKELQDTEVRKE